MPSKNQRNGMANLVNETRLSLCSSHEAKTIEVCSVVESKWSPQIL